MRSQLRSFIATKSAAGLAGLLLACAAVAAPPAGTVTRVDGPLLAQKADGRMRVIAQGAAVDVGDTLFTGHDAYAEIRFADKSDAILQPDTQLTIDAFPVDAARGAGDARWTLAQGGMQVTSGEIAARGAGHHTIATPLGTIAVEKSKFVVSVAPPAAAGAVAALDRVYLAANDTGTLSDAQAPIVIAQLTPPGLPQGPKLPAPGSIAPGLYVQVIDGLINLTNKGGSQSFAAGQFGFVGSQVSPPVVVPANPGIQFMPPPSFSQPTNSTSGSSPPKSNTVDCEVR